MVIGQVNVDIDGVLVPGHSEKQDATATRRIRPETLVQLESASLLQRTGSSTSPVVAGEKHSPGHSAKPRTGPVAQFAGASTGLLW